MNWESVSWEQFEGALLAYREKFYQKGAQGEESYLEVMDLLGRYAAHLL